MMGAVYCKLCAVYCVLCVVLCAVYRVLRTLFFVLCSVCLRFVGVVGNMRWHCLWCKMAQALTQDAAQEA